VQLSQNLEMHCVIEGVEDPFALKFAAELGCGEAQGFHIARPMPASEIREFELTWRWRRASLETSIRAPEAAELDEQQARPAG
jgi:EAL domain-containing protein (putative c-di-GMP-specific phosphodiesterase class I)